MKLALTHGRLIAVRGDTSGCWPLSSDNTNVALCLDDMDTGTRKRETSRPGGSAVLRARDSPRRQVRVDRSAMLYPAQ